MYTRKKGYNKINPITYIQMRNFQLLLNPTNCKTAPPTLASRGTKDFLGTTTPDFFPACEPCWNHVHSLSLQGIRNSPLLPQYKIKETSNLSPDPCMNLFSSREKSLTCQHSRISQEQHHGITSPSGRHDAILKNSSGCQIRGRIGPPKGGSDVALAEGSYLGNQKAEECCIASARGNRSFRHVRLRQSLFE